MEDKLRQMLQPAFREVPAREANQAISRARRERAGGDPDDDDGPALRSYEIVLSTWETFLRDQLPKLVYHLESIGAHLPECKGVMISAFLGERLFFVDAKALLERVCRMAAISADQLVELHGTGERRTALRDDPLLLPPPKGRN